MATSLNGILGKLAMLDSADLAFIQQQIADELMPHAPAPTLEKELLAPGHHLEEKAIKRGDKVHIYTVERWYEPNGSGYKHKSKSVFKGTKSAYLAELAKAAA